MVAPVGAVAVPVVSPFANIGRVETYVAPSWASARSWASAPDYVSTHCPFYGLYTLLYGLKILFIYPKSDGLGSFIEKDFKIIASKHDVELIAFDRVRHDFLSVLDKVRKCDLVFNWFCGLHALVANVIARLFKKKSVTVVGGYEVACFPQINYGQFVNKNHKYITLLGLKLTDLVINISKYSQKDTINNASVPIGKTRMIYHGFSEQPFKRDFEIQKKLCLKA